MSIRNIIAGSISAAGRYFFFIMAFVGVFTMTSCSESDDTEDEFENWQERNDTYFNNIYSQAETAIKSGDKSWKIIRTFSKDSLAAKAKTDFIVVHVETEGTGTESPIFSGRANVHYRGYFIPTTNHANGLQFDSSWTGEYNLKTMIPSEFSVSNVIPGFSTALMNMHKGDRWMVYIPHPLAYGITGNTKKDSYGNIIGTAIPAYSTLRFDLTLVDYVNGGGTLPKYQ